MDEIRESIETLETAPDNAPEPVPQRSFTTSQSVFAWVALVAGYLFCRVFPVIMSPFGGFLLILALFAVTTVILKLQGAKFSKMPVLAAISALVVSAALVVSSSGLLHQLSYAYALMTYGYYVYSATGNALQNGFSDYILADYLKALVVLPFCSFGQVFRAMFYGKAKSGGKLFGKMLLGIALAVVPTVIVMSLLSYDQGFSEILWDILDFGFLDVVSHMFSIGCGIPIGMYIFGLFVSSVDGGKAPDMNAETMHGVSLSVRKMPAVTAFAAALPLILVYVVFFISQWKYYVSGFLWVLPDERSYSDYARDGFFQLCTVSVINLVVIIVLSVFMRRSESNKSAVLRLLSVVYSVFTLVLISTAMAKMVMYIDCYGLTPKRVYASWFMLVLAAVFILIIAKQFAVKLKLIATSLAVCVVFFAALSLSNVDGLIAKYNVDRYLDGTLETVDVDALYDLGDAAVPEMARLAEEMDDRNGTDIEAAVKDPYSLKAEDNDPVYIALARELRSAADDFYDDHDGIFSYTLQALRAESALEKIGAFDQ